MFPRDQRLRYKRDIVAVLKRGRIFRNSFFMVRVLANRLPHPRTTVVISTAVSKRANIRNKIKRQLRHILINELKNINRGFDLMVSVRPTVLKISLEERRRALLDLLWRARLIDKKTS